MQNGTQNIWIRRGVFQNKLYRRNFLWTFSLPIFFNFLSVKTLSTDRWLAFCIKRYKWLLDSPPEFRRLRATFLNWSCYSFSAWFVEIRITFRKKNDFLCLKFTKLAFKTGGRWPWLFFAAMIHGMIIEMICYFLPFVQNFWHAQGIITLFDHRMPLYVAIIRRNHTWYLHICVISSNLFDVLQCHRSFILLSCVMGGIQTKTEKWIGGVHGRGPFDRVDRYAVRYNRN